MCGRYLLHADPKLIERAFGAEFSQIPRELVPRWNIAPTQRVPIVRNRPGRELKIVRQSEGRGRELATVRWGLIPAWTKDPAISNRMINARAEGVADKPAFRSAFRARRCIVPASGFYEWQRQGRGPKQPYLIRRRDGEPIGFAGLWESWDKDARRNAMTLGTVAIQDVLRLIIPPDLQSLPGARGKAWGAQVWAEQSLTRSSSRRQLHPRPRPRPFVPARGGSRTRPGGSSSLADCGQLGCLLR
jgi:putative SOS response-associated peptidase YedK